MEGFLLTYERVPVTDEKSPKESDFDILVCVMFIYILISFMKVYRFLYKVL